MATPDPSSEVRVWDAGLRGFHWLLAASVLFALASGFAGGDWMVWHGRAGQFTLALLGFRLAWGFVGGGYARFRNFWPGPRAVWAALRGRWAGLGHNPLGALSVLFALAWLALQVFTGLVGSDEIAFTGPWAHRVSEAASLTATTLHRRLAWLGLAWIGLHLLAIAWHRWRHGERLLRAMLTGRRAGRPEQAATPPRPRAWAWALGSTSSVLLVLWSLAQPGPAFELPLRQADAGVPAAATPPASAPAADAASAPRW